MSGQVAVVDVETTGFGRADRIVEIACVTVDLDGGIVGEWATLVNPMRDISREVTAVHGLSSSDVEAAPTFAVIAGTVASVLSGRVIAAHNLSFDTRMLRQEYTRLRVDWPAGGGLCTMHTASLLGAPVRNLEGCCRRFGVELDTAHAALGDARATAQLLLALMDGHPELMEEVQRLVETAVSIPAAGLGTSMRTHQRSTVRARRDRSYVTRLTAGLPAHPELSSEQNSYLGVLDVALEDLVITRAEKDKLEAVALDLGLDQAEIDAAHRVYFDDLVAAALRDGQVTAAERRELDAVAAALGFEKKLETRLKRVGRAHGVTLKPGARVCLTGSADVSVGGKAWSRTLAEELARSAGLVPVDSVSRKCELVVAGDTTTMSKKARTARGYGISVIGVREFLDLMGAG